MSHSKEREEKICLNCGAELTGRYCNNCGQENTEPKETFWTLVSHFFNDITHFDGKFFSTGKYLFTKPGFLSAEYIKGRRARYLHPIRMYVFTSAFFFIIFFSLVKPSDMIDGGNDKEEQLKELTEASKSIDKKLSAKNDADLKDADIKNAILRSQNNIDKHAAALKQQIEEEARKDSIGHLRTKTPADSAGVNINPKTAGYPLIRVDAIDSIVADKEKHPSKQNVSLTTIEVFYTLSAYDSVQKEIPEKKKDGWLARTFTRKGILLSKKYGGNNKEATELFMEKYMHTLPQALFVSLPAFALILLMLYARRKFYYADHAIFSIHLYCAAMIILLLYFGIDKIQISTGWKWLEFFKVVTMFGIFFYAYTAMRNFYQQGIFKTLLKFIILNIFSLFIVVILSGAFAALSLIQFS